MLLPPPTTPSEPQPEPSRAQPELSLLSPPHATANHAYLAVLLLATVLRATAPRSTQTRARTVAGMHRWGLLIGLALLADTAAASSLGSTPNTEATWLELAATLAALTPADGLDRVSERMRSLLIRPAATTKPPAQEVSNARKPTPATTPSAWVYPPRGQEHWQNRHAPMLTLIRSEPDPSLVQAEPQPPGPLAQPRPSSKLGQQPHSMPPPSARSMSSHRPPPAASHPVSSHPSRPKPPPPSSSWPSLPSTAPRPASRSRPSPSATARGAPPGMPETTAQTVRHARPSPTTSP